MFQNAKESTEDDCPPWGEDDDTMWTKTNSPEDEQMKLSDVSI